MTDRSPLDPPRFDPVPADRPLRMVVIGAGRWGGLHAAKLAGLPGVELVAVIDRDIERARCLAQRHGIKALAEVGALAELPDLHGATVAVDLPQIAPITARLLERDLHVLAEKPLALDAPEARSLVRLAARRRRLLAVGYLERFVAPAGRGLRLVARRVGPPRSTAPLWLDWMVHDLDHALRLLGPALRPVAAEFAADRARICLAAGDREARIVAAHRGQRARRRLWLDGERIDLTAAADPLGLQLAAFCRAVRGGAAGPLATGADAVAVLDLLDALQAARPAA